MDFALTEEQVLIRDTTREFARDEIAPHARRLESGGGSAAPLLGRLSEMGYLGMAVPADAGGGGVDALAVAVAVEELARGDAGLALVVAIQNAVLAPWLALGATEPQRAARLEALASGEGLGCVGLGFDATRPLAEAQPLRAGAVSSGYTLAGEHRHVIHGGAAAWILAFAGAGNGDAAVFLHDLPATGVRAGAAGDSLGLRLAAAADLRWEACGVPPLARVAAAGDAARAGVMAARGLALAGAATCLGIAEEAFQAALAYGQERAQFGRQIAFLPAIQTKLAQMRAEVDGARLLVRHAAWLASGGGENGLREALQAKIIAGQSAVRATHAALQVFGGYGCMEEYPIARLFRDARTVAGLFGGTRDPMAFVARELLGQNAV